MKMKEDLIRSIGKNSKADSSAPVVGSKVLPFCDSSTSSSSSSSSSSSLSSSKADDQQQCAAPTGQKKNTSLLSKGETNSRSKTLSRMKELFRWAAAAKSDRGKLGNKVLHFRNKSATIKTGGLDEEIKKNESPKISIKWEVGSCDTSCSAASAPPSIRYDESCHHRTGNWITTDDEFVVLEL